MSSRGIWVTRPEVVRVTARVRTGFYEPSRSASEDLAKASPRTVQGDYCRETLKALAPFVSFAEKRHEIRTGKDIQRAESVSEQRR
jgi:hypothetical protein